ncbi:hypothetical protein R3P38DRAFT_3177029 [Favolaschia claudopus]|uniref:Uncharacterized protein n=1 Tax=Favolaschia claudopus TaxID=2862362 RepID=A0AAW0D1F8_9AGAR
MNTSGTIRPFTLVCLFTLTLLVRAGVHQHRHPRLALSARDALADSGLTSASWIWDLGSSAGNVAFLKTFSSSVGKIASSATISFTAANSATLWVNGQPVGQSNDWKVAEVLSAALNASSNTFSVFAASGGSSPPAGFLAAIKVQYSDGSVDTVLSDSSWKSSANIPSDFPLPADTSRFTSATVAASFGSGAWGTAVNLTPPNPNVPTLVGGTWIWSTFDGEYAAPAGTVAFRKNVVTPNGKKAQSAAVLLTADNTFAFYVNGKYVGAPPFEANAVVESTAWGRAQQFSVGLNPASNTFTVIVTNFLNPTSGATSPAGLVASIRVVYADGSSDLLGTDPSWLNGPYTSVADFLAVPDSALVASFNVAAVGAWPWGSLSGVSDVLAAAVVPSAPFTESPASSGSQGNSNSSTGERSGLGLGVNSMSASVNSVSHRGASGAAVSSTVHSGSSAGSAFPTPGTDAGNFAPSSTVTSNSATHNNSTPVAAIVGAIASTLTLLFIGLAGSCWYRRRRTRLRRHLHSAGSSIIAPLNNASEAHNAQPVTSSLENDDSPSTTELPVGSILPFLLPMEERAGQAPGPSHNSPTAKAERELMSSRAIEASISTDTPPSLHTNNLQLEEAYFSDAEPDTRPPPSYYTE